VKSKEDRFCLWIWLQRNSVGDKPNTFQKIGDALGLTGAAIQQQFKYGIQEKLRELLKKEAEKDY